MVRQYTYNILIYIYITVAIMEVCLLAHLILNLRHLRSLILIFRSVIYFDGVYFVFK